MKLVKYLAQTSDKKNLAVTVKKTKKKKGTTTISQESQRPNK